MQITAKLYATFRIITGEKTIVIDAPEGATVIQAVRMLAEMRPALKPHWFDQNGELYSHVHVFLNGEDAMTLPAQMESVVTTGRNWAFFHPSQVDNKKRNSSSSFFDRDFRLLLCRP